MLWGARTGQAALESTPLCFVQSLPGLEWSTVTTNSLTSSSFVLDVRNDSSVHYCTAHDYTIVLRGHLYRHDHCARIDLHLYRTNQPNVYDRIRPDCYDHTASNNTNFYSGDQPDLYDHASGIYHHPNNDHRPFDTDCDYYSFRPGHESDDHGGAQDHLDRTRHSDGIRTDVDSNSWRRDGDGDGFRAATDHICDTDSVRSMMAECVMLE